VYGVVWLRVTDAVKRFQATLGRGPIRAVADVNDCRVEARNV
jgi:hypothetical protein